MNHVYSVDLVSLPYKLFFLHLKHKLTWIQGNYARLLKNQLFYKMIIYDPHIAPKPDLIIRISPFFTSSPWKYHEKLKDKIIYVCIKGPMIIFILMVIFHPIVAWSRWISGYLVMKIQWANPQSIKFQQKMWISSWKARFDRKLNC